MCTYSGMNILLVLFFVLFLPLLKSHRGVISGPERQMTPEEMTPEICTCCLLDIYFDVVQDYMWE